MSVAISWTILILAILVLSLMTGVTLATDLGAKHLSIIKCTLLGFAILLAVAVISTILITAASIAIGTLQA